MAISQKIMANLWFANEAEDAVNFYVSIFKNSSIVRKAYYTEEGHDIHRMAAGTVMTIEFELDGVQFLALNGGPVFKFNEAVSFIVNCANQQEVDYYWDKLREGGDERAQVCGWLKDKFGVSWQVTPLALADMMADENIERKNRVMKAMLQMKKIELPKLEEAYKG